MNLQQPFDAAVAMPTILRPSLLQAVRAIFAQDLQGRVQIVLGIDRGPDAHGILDTLRSECPSHMALTVIDPGYSTARRNGGLYVNDYGGALRTALSYLANSRFVAFLDDDNWWAPSHLSSLLRAIDGKAYAFSLRTLVDGRTDAVICRDEWESVGPGKGVYVKGFGGWIDTSCLMVDKLACHDALPGWALSVGDSGTGDDRMVFDRLKGKPVGATSEYTAFYRIVLDGVHPYLLWNYRKAGVDLARFVSPAHLPSDAVWAQCAAHDRSEAAARPPAPPAPTAAPPAATVPSRTAYASAPVVFSYPKR
jgi:hypothetical protein